MFNSLAVQYLFQTPDYHLFTQRAGCISGCVSGIPPVLELGHRVSVDETIIRPTLPSNSSTTKNIGRDIFDIFNRLRSMVAVLLEES